MMDRTRGGPQLLGSLPSEDALAAKGSLRSHGKRPTYSPGDPVGDNPPSVAPMAAQVWMEPGAAGPGTFDEGQRGYDALAPPGSEAAGGRGAVCRVRTETDLPPLGLESVSRGEAADGGQARRCSPHGPAPPGGGKVGDDQGANPVFAAGEDEMDARPSSRSPQASLQGSARDPFQAAETSHYGSTDAPTDGGDLPPMSPECGGEVAQSPLVIPADASLVDGLRALLVHHLKRSVGSNIVSLSASQAELLEHHLARLASYAQKIVHTLAFATRFLSKSHFEGDTGEPETPHPDEGVRPNGASMAAERPPSADQRQPRKALKLNDDEILSLYRSAQMEAAIEADWRGIHAGPTPSRVASDGGFTSRSNDQSLGAPEAGPYAKDDGDQEYLRMLSRALQQPGRSPRAMTAELLDASKGALCCQPRIGAGLDDGAAAIAHCAIGQGSGRALRPPGGPPDPGSHRVRDPV